MVIDTTDNKELEQKERSRLEELEQVVDPKCLPGADGEG